MTNPTDPSPEPARSPRECDVLIVGGGPAGTSTGILLARRGWSVTLFEKDHHPRFHIGESLLPMNLPIFEKLGVLDDVRRIGVYKAAADFTGRGQLEHRTSRFAGALGRSPDHAFQVTRAELDAILFERCRAAGADVREGHRVKRVLLAASGRHEVEVESGGGIETWRCRYLVDASGQDSLLARQHGWRARDRRHSAAAFFAHFRNVPRRAGDEAGNISIYWFEHGWIWMIPLRNGITSVGAVCESDFVRNRRRTMAQESEPAGDGANGNTHDAERFLALLLAASPAAAARLAGAERVTPALTAANYSYASSRQTGPGFALVGDAYTFVDPVFSSGVYLAMSSAEALVPAIELWLRGQRIRYRLATFAYRRRIGRGLDAFKWFIYRFNTPAMVWLFENPRNVLNLQRAVVSLLAGDVYDAPAIRLRLVLFKALYRIVAAIERLAPERLGFAAGSGRPEDAEPST